MKIWDAQTGFALVAGGRFKRVEMVQQPKASTTVVYLYNKRVMRGLNTAANRAEVALIFRL